MIGTRSLFVAAAAVLTGLVASAGVARTAGVAKHGMDVSQISGYRISAVDFGWSTDGRAVDKVSFRLDARAVAVKVALVADPAAQDWTDCGASTASAPYSVTCTLSAPVPAARATSLAIVAAG